MLKYIASALLPCVLLTTAACSGGGKAGAPTPVTTPVSSPISTPAPTITATAQPAINITQPPTGATVDVPFTVSGDANVFEGALQVAVEDASGQPLCQRSVQATSGSGTPGTWSTTIAIPPPTSTLGVRLRAFDYSARDGSEENTVSREITISSKLPAIVIDSPRCNSAFGPTAAIEVTGTAEVFEAALTVELRGSGGRALLQEHILASTGTGRGTWTASFDLSQLPPGGGAYELVAYDLSARDGAVENEFSIPITVTP